MRCLSLQSPASRPSPKPQSQAFSLQSTPLAFVSREGGQSYQTGNKSELRFRLRCVGVMWTGKAKVEMGYSVQPCGNGKPAEPVTNGFTGEDPVSG